MENGKMRAVGSLVAGGILGAGVALLFAPKSGKRARRDMCHLGKKIMNRSEAVRLELGHSLDNLVDDISEKVTDELDRRRDWTKDWTHKTRRDVQRLYGTGKDYFHGGMKRLTRA